MCAIFIFAFFMLGGTRAQRLTGRAVERPPGFDWIWLSASLLYDFDKLSTFVPLLLSRKMWVTE